MCVCAGSPFQYSVGQLSLGGPHKVQVGGPGLEKGEVGIRSECAFSLLPFVSFTLSVLGEKALVAPGSRTRESISPGFHLSYP